MSSEFTSASWDSTPNIYLEEQGTGGYTNLSNEAIAAKVLEYEGVLTQKGVNPRAAEAARRILAHLSFERQSRAGAYSNTIATTVVDGAVGEVLETEDGVIELRFDGEEPVSYGPSSLTSHDQ
jgi:hypothetical protein